MGVIYIETERLMLRDWKQEDLPLFQQMNVDRQVREYFPDIMSYRRSEIIFHHMQEEISRSGLGLFAVELKSSGEFIGFIGMQYLEKSPIFSLDIMPCYEIGWRLRAEFWGKGYATEGAKAVLEYAYRHIDLPVYSFTSVHNERSIHVMEKIGLKKIETFNHPLLPARHPLARHVLYKEE